MRLKNLSIQRQTDNTFALIALIVTKAKVSTKVMLSSGGVHAGDLQKAYMFLLNDKESLHAEIDYRLRGTSARLHGMEKIS
jgi:hypothetical protein